MTGIFCLISGPLAFSLLLLANTLIEVSHDRGHKSTSITPPLLTNRLLESLRVTSSWLLMTVFDKAYCEDTANASKAVLCSDKVSMYLDVCLTCDPGAMLAAYGSNWPARKLTKCQWSVVPQEVINCAPPGQWESPCLYLLPAIDAVCMNHVISCWDSLK